MGKLSVWLGNFGHPLTHSLVDDFYGFAKLQHCLVELAVVVVGQGQLVVAFGKQAVVSLQVLLLQGQTGLELLYSLHVVFYRSKPYGLYKQDTFI